MPRKSKKSKKAPPARRLGITTLTRLLRERTVAAVPIPRRLKRVEALLVPHKDAGRVRKFYKTKNNPNRSDAAYVTLLSSTDPETIKQTLRKLGKGGEGAIRASLAASYVTRSGQLNITGTTRFHAGDDGAVEQALRDLHKKLAPGGSKGGIQRNAESVKAVMIQLTFSKSQWNNRSKTQGKVVGVPPVAKRKPKRKTKRARSR